MASVNQRGGKLFFDFRYGGSRCREYTALSDTPANRRRMEAVLKKIEEDIALNRFDYRRYFPNSPMAARFSSANAPAAVPESTDPVTDATPLFKAFAEDWYRDKSVEWRRSYQEAVRFILDKHLLPALGDLHLAQIDRARVLALRTHLATDGARQRNPATTNKIMGILSMVMAEATLRLSTTNPCASVKRLKLKRKDIQPFTMDEVSLLVRSVRVDYAEYLLVRCLTGMRSGEVHGLRWEHVDFERREIRIRQTYAHGRVEYTKTDGSQREIWMSQPVHDALRRMQTRTGAAGGYVFCTQGGTPLDNHNFIKRVWNPLLRHLGLKPRRPYEMRHTCATLWLAAGENPEWIARQLGHTTTEMLFRVYSRYVPNLTRRDGSAFDSLVSSVIQTTPPANDLSSVSPQRKEPRHG